MKKYKASVIIQKEMSAVDYAQFLRDKIDMYRRVVANEREELAKYIQRKSKKIQSTENLIDKKEQELIAVIKDNQLNPTYYGRNK